MAVDIRIKGEGRAETITDVLRGSVRGLGGEDPNDYLPRGVTAADCLIAANEIDRLRRLVTDLTK